MVASGFLLEAGELLFWVSAGHVIQEICKAQADGLVIQMRWQDGGTPSIPTAPGLLDQFRTDEDGIDIAIVELDAVTAANLRAGPHFCAFQLADCLTRAELESVFSTHPADELWILGYPQEWATFKEVPAAPGQVWHQLKVRAVQIPIVGGASRESVESSGASTEESFWSPNCMFALMSGIESPESDPLGKIEGVSGGPVVATKGGRDYVIGIQTAWLPGARVVRIVPIDQIKRRVGGYLAWRKSRRPPQSADNGAGD